MNELELFFGFLETIFGFFPVVAVAAPLIALLIDAGKRIKINGNPLVADGYAQLWSLGFNVAFFALLYFAGDQRAEFEGVIGSITEAAVVLFPLLLGLLSTRLAHSAWNYVGLAYSHTIEALD